MELVAAIVACAAWGAGNFIMGLTSRHVSSRFVVFVSFLTGLLCTAALVVVMQPNLEAQSLLWGAVAGVAQGAGWLLFAFSMKVGRISAAAPISAAVATIVPYTVGAIGGDLVTVASAMGAMCALVAVVLLTRPDKEGPVENDGHTWLAALSAVCSGLLFAGQFLALRHVSESAPLSTVLGASFAVVVVVGIAILVRKPASGTRTTFPWSAVGAGAAILVGDFAFIYAVARGPLTSVVAVTALHPAVTVLLAATILSERANKLQKVGIGLALVGIFLIAS